MIICHHQHLLQVIDDSDDPVSVYQLTEPHVLVVVVQQPIVADVVATQPIPCIRVDVVKAQPWTSCREPHLNAQPVYIGNELIGIWEHQSPTLVASLSVCQLGLSVLLLGNADVILHLTVAVPPAIGPLETKVPAAEGDECVVVVGQGSINVYCDDGSQRLGTR